MSKSDFSKRVEQYASDIKAGRPLLWEMELPVYDSASCEEMYECSSAVCTELCHDINNFGEEDNEPQCA